MKTWICKAGREHHVLSGESSCLWLDAALGIGLLRQSFVSPGDDESFFSIDACF
jgi:hypothetical protein